MAMADSTCSVDGCAKRAHSKNMCATHYTRVRKLGRTFRPCAGCGGDIPDALGQVKYCTPECRPGCKAEGCGKPRRSLDGYCARHKALVRRHGKPKGKYEWTPESDAYVCVVCGDVFSGGHGRRKHCSNNCQALDSTYAGEVPPLDFDCALCGKHFKRNRKDALHQRSDKMLCDRCRRSREKRHKSSPGFLARRDGTDCGICGDPVDMTLVYPELMRGSVDHILPVAHGGTHDEDNLQLSHLRCNLRKQAQLDYVPG